VILRQRQIPFVTFHRLSQARVYLLITLWPSDGE
jgi:hypothetical protein